MPATRTRKRQAGRTQDDVLDQRFVKAISHPIRHKVLVMLNDRVASPNEMATEMGESLGRVSYHVRRLAEIGAIELVRTEPRRGAVEHYYRAKARPWFSGDDWALLPKSTRHDILGQSLGRLGADVVAAAAGEGFDHDRVHVSSTPLALDDRALADLGRLLEGTLERALELQAESAGRRAGDSGRARTATKLAILHFAA
jgi:DNA-binding transcriptional ArsR family regulator